MCVLSYWWKKTFLWGSDFDTCFFSLFYVWAEATGSLPGTPQRVTLNTGPKTTLTSSTTAPNSAAPKRISSKTHSTANVSVFNKSDVIPVIVPRTNVRLDQATESRKEVGASGRTISFSSQSRASDFRKSPNRRDELERSTVAVPSENAGSKAMDLSTVADRNVFPAVKSSIQGISAAERNVKDERCIGSGRQEMNSMMEPPPNYQHDNCMSYFLETHGCLVPIFENCFLFLNTKNRETCLISLYFFVMRNSKSTKNTFSRKKK